MTTTRPARTTVPPWLDGLDERQREAVEHRGRDLLVIAGAGSGKTRTLASRAASLLADGVPAERILLLTFTRRAAQDMMQRSRTLAATASGGLPGRLQGGTFHAVANGILRANGRLLGLHDGFTVLDESDAVDVLAQARTQVVADRTGDGRFPRASTLTAIMSRVANAQEPLTEVVRRSHPWCADDLDGMRDVFGRYAEAKRRSNAVDFDDLLLYWRALLADPTTGPLLRGRWDHVLVDEYQDVNAIQADIVQALGTPAGDHPGATITAVGDDAQAIYGFRASSPEHILSFPQRHHPADVVTLERSHRCTTPILAVANAIQAEAAQQYRKELWTDRPGGLLPRLVTTHDEAEQSESVCDAVLDARERGIDLRAQAVLYRTGTHANDLELALSRRNIPFRKFGGLRFLERSHVKDLHAMLRVADNPGDVLAWHRILRLGEGIGPTWVRRLCEQLGVGRWRHDDGPADSPMARILAATPQAPASAVGYLDALREAWQVAIGAGAPSPADEAPDPGAQVEALRPACTIAWTRVHADHPARLADLDRLAVAATRHRTRSAFLADLTLDPPTSTGDLAGPPHLDDDWLTLSTIHSAKGLEWRAVHLIHAADGNLPSDMALRDRDGIEEERRLAYVAVTRARDELTVTVPLRYHRADRGPTDQHSWAQVSRFLQPITHLFDQQAPPTATAPPAAGAAIPTVVEDRLATLWAS